MPFFCERFLWWWTFINWTYLSLCSQSILSLWLGIKGSFKMNSSKNDQEVRRILRRTQENVDQSGESKAPLAWHVVKTKGVANQSWSKTFISTVAKENISIVLELLLLDTCPSGQTNVKLKPTFGAGCKSKISNMMYFSLSSNNIQLSQTRVKLTWNLSGFMFKN